MLITTDPRYKHYKANEDRIILKDGLLFRKYFGETGNVNYYQILIPKQIVIEVLRSVQRDFRKHPRGTKTVNAYREKNYLPKMAQMIREWIMSCEQSIRETEIDRNFNPLPLQSTNEHITAQEEAMQIDLVPELPMSVAMKTL